MFVDPLFEEHELTTNDVAELAGQPAAARAVLTLYHAYQSSRETVEALAARISENAQLPGRTSRACPRRRSRTSSRGTGIIFRRSKRLPKALIREARLEPDDLYGTMVRHLRDVHGVEVSIVTIEKSGTALRRYDPETKRLSLSESSPRAAEFQHCPADRPPDALAGVPGDPRRRAPHDARLGHARPHRAVELLRVRGSHAVRAVPRGGRSRALRHRAPRPPLPDELRAGLPPPHDSPEAGASGVPFHFVRVDIAGNTSKRFSASGIRFARFSAPARAGTCTRRSCRPATSGRSSRSCPTARSTSASRAPSARAAAATAGHTLLAVGLGCALAHAKRLVYADGVDVTNDEALVPIGTSCRLCERTDCEQRAFPPVQQRLSIDENVRAVSFYAPPPPQRGLSLSPLRPPPPRSGARSRPPARPSRSSRRSSPPASSRSTSRP